MSSHELAVYAKAKLDMASAKQNLYERIQADSTFAFSGGLFKSTPELINFINFHINHGIDKFVIEDEYHNPVMIENPEKFLEQASKIYHEVHNDWYCEYMKLRQTRNVDQIR